MNGNVTKEGITAYLEAMARVGIGGAQIQIAEVELSGKDLGILWQPPFRLDVTEALVSGDNALTVKITNLWPNRLTGDEQLPPDRDWNPVGTLKAWRNGCWRASRARAGGLHLPPGATGTRTTSCCRPDCWARSISGRR